MVRSLEARRSRARFLIALGVSAFALGLAPSACIYPSFTFNEAEPTGGAGGGGTGQEKCGNQLDDDGDGDIDCADADCGGAGYTCVAGIPLGWSGYQSLYAGPKADAPAACPAAFPSPIPYKGTASPTAAPAMCTACSCTAPMGEMCDLPDTIMVIEQTCPNAQQSVMPTNLAVPANWDGACDANGGAPGNQTCGAGACNRAVRSAAPVLVSGTCTPSGGTATIPMVDWAVHGTACGDAPAGGGCGAGQICQPAPPAPFLPGLCIFRDGEQDCPGAPFTDKHILYEAADDTRACSPCACADSTGGSCSANITVYTDAACAGSLVTFAAGACAALNGNPAVNGRTAQIMPIAPGSCPKSGGEATGDHTPKQPTTFCCAP